MKTKLSKKRAISTVLTTVIILVSSVVLGSGVVLYGTSLFQAGTQTEQISVTGLKIWVHPTDATGIAWGAAAVRNTGDKVVAVDKISLRGTDVPFGQWYADTDVSAAVFQQALNHTGWVNISTGPSMIKNGDCSSSSEYVAIDPDGTTGGTFLVADCILADAASANIQSATVSVFAGKAGGPQSISVAGQN